MQTDKARSLMASEWVTAKALLDRHQRVWQSKASLRAIYGHYFEIMFRNSVSGKTLEIGAGSGNLRDSGYHVISTDIVKMSCIDVVSDAHLLPFADGSLANIVAVDVFHHLQRPVRFLREAQRLLKPGGRLIMLEPGITWVSGVLYRKFHPEPVDMTVDPLADGPLENSRDPFDANQAMGTLLATRYRESLSRVVPELSVHSHRWLGSIAYPLSGGFQEWSLVPSVLTRPMLALESLIDQLFGRWVAFRILLILDRH